MRLSMVCGFDIWMWIISGNIVRSIFEEIYLQLIYSTFTMNKRYTVSGFFSLILGANAPNKSIKAKRPYSAIRLIYPAAGNGRFGLIFWISDYRRTADILVMLYAGLLLNQFLIPAKSLSTLLGSMVS